MRKEIRLEDLGPPVSHYTDAVRFGDLLFISGIATDGDGNVIGKGNPVAQAEDLVNVVHLCLLDDGAGDAPREALHDLDLALASGCREALFKA